jgi:CDP-4-dehydro-6-deoxyglucose reductase, E3
MANVIYGGKTYTLEPGETVLGGLLRNGIPIPNACRAGACQSCLMKADKGVVPASAQTGLKDTMKARGYFLSCLCRPEGDLEVRGAGAEVRVPGVIVGLDKLSSSVVRVRVRPLPPGGGAWEYRPGQYAVLLRKDGLARSYSIASLPSEDALEMHVRKMPNGRMSGWLFDEARVGDELLIQGPSGECFYVPGQADQPILLAGTGTGLSPLYGVLRDALGQRHTGPIYLFHGARDVGGLYMTDELRALAGKYANVRYRPSVYAGEPRGDVRAGALDKLILGELPKLRGFRVFLCGGPDIVAVLRKKAFLAGAALKDIHADPFLPTAS